MGAYTTEVQTNGGGVIIDHGDGDGDGVMEMGMGMGMEPWKWGWGWGRMGMDGAVMEMGSGLWGCRGWRLVIDSLEMMPRCRDYLSNTTTHHYHTPIHVFSFSSFTLLFAHSSIPFVVNRPSSHRLIASLF